MQNGCWRWEGARIEADLSTLSMSGFHVLTENLARPRGLPLEEEEAMLCEVAPLLCDMSGGRGRTHYSNKFCEKRNDYASCVSLP